MRRDTRSSDYAMGIGATLAFVSALILMLFLPLVHADVPADLTRPDRLTGDYVGRLAQKQRRLLQESIRSSIRRISSKDSAAAIPEYQIYHSIFLELMMKPLLAAGLPAQDLELLRALPAHNDQRFVTAAIEAMTGACRVINRSHAASPAAVNLAVNGFNQARHRLESQMNRHYRSTLQRLTDTGRQLVQAEYERLVEEGSLVYAEIDLVTLGFSEPEFVLAFLQDSCANAEHKFSKLATVSHTLKDQLENDHQRGAVQLFQSR